MEEAAAAAKRSRSEHHHGVADGPSFRMEDLPAEVQPVIISLLPLKEAVRTSIVSRSWRMLWTFHCDLCFHGPDDSKFYTADQHSAPIKRANFIEAVNLVIQQHSGLESISSASHVACTKSTLMILTGGFSLPLRQWKI